MKATNRTVPIEILLQTVALVPNKQDPDNIYLFRCYHCGTGVSKIQGNIASITAGHIPSSEVPVVNQCHMCKENYMFKTFSSKPAESIKLILVPHFSQSVSIFYCVICRTPLLKYSDSSALLTANMQQMKIPFPFACSLESCGKDYLLNEIVSMVE